MQANSAVLDNRILAGRRLRLSSLSAPDGEARADLEDTGSWLATPMLAGGAAIGALGPAFQPDSPPDATLIATLEAIASQIGQGQSLHRVLVVVLSALRARSRGFAITRGRVRSNDWISPPVCRYADVMSGPGYRRRSATGDDGERWLRTWRR